MTGAERIVLMRGARKHYGGFVSIFVAAPVVMGVLMAVPVAAQHGGGQPAGPAVQQQIPPAPEPHPFKLKSSTVELGNIKPGTPAKVSIDLFNASSRPVSVTRVTTTCTCMANDSDLPRIVSAGEASSFSVTFKGRPNPGVVHERVTVWYQDKNGREKNFVVPINGEITYPVKAEPFYVNLLLEDRTGTIELSSTDGVYFKVLSAGGMKPVFQGERDGSAVAFDHHVLKFDFTDVPDDKLENFYLIQTTHPESPLLDLRVIHRGLITRGQGQEKKEWAVSQDRFVLGRMSEGDSNDVTVRVVGMPQVEGLPSVTTSSEMVHAEVIEERANDSRGREFAIRLTLLGTEDAMLLEKMTLSLGGESKVFDLFVWANPSE